MPFRVDRVALRHDLRPPEKRPDGSTLYHGAVTRSGVFEYELEDGSKRREYRPPEEVSDPASLKTLHLAPVVAREHTPKGEARHRSVGTVGQDVQWVPAKKEVQASFVVRPDDVNRDVANGMQELSCGYDVDLEETPGVTPDGERYDAIQRGMPRGDGKRGPIVYEHLAIVPSGRAGSSVRLRADSAAKPARRSWRTDAATMTPASATSAAASNSPAAASRSKGPPMAQSSTRTDCGENGGMMPPEQKKDGAMPPPGGDPNAPPMSPEEKLKALEEENAKLKAELAKTQAAQDAPIPRATDSAPPAAEEDEEMVATDSAGRADAKAVRAAIDARFEREKLLGVAKQVGATVRADAKRSDIKIAIVEKLEGKKLPQERVDAADKVMRQSYIDARYEIAMERHGAALAAEATARTGGGFVPQVRQDSAQDPIAKAYAAQQSAYASRSSVQGAK